MLPTDKFSSFRKKDKNLTITRALGPRKQPNATSVIFVFDKNATGTRSKVSHRSAKRAAAKKAVKSTAQNRQQKRPGWKHIEELDLSKERQQLAMIPRIRPPGLSDSYLKVWAPPPFGFSNEQVDRKLRRQVTGRDEWRDMDWLVCPWNQHGCLYVSKTPGTFNRHVVECFWNPDPPPPQTCPECVQNQVHKTYTRAYRLLQHREEVHGYMEAMEE